LRTLGFAGTAKNTGKTTTLNHVHQRLRELGENSALLTSIGLDGEPFDNLTLLPKPRIEVYPGDYAVTAEMCLQKTTARFTRIFPLALSTPLGALSVVKIESRGELLLAGPSSLRGAIEVINAVETLPVTTVLLDGALNRILPLSVCDDWFLATGAARHTDPATLTDELMSLLQIFQNIRQTSLFCDKNPRAGIYRNGILWVAFNEDEPFLNRMMLDQYRVFADEHTVLYWPKLVLTRILIEFLEKINPDNMLHLVVRHPFYLIADGNFRQISTWIGRSNQLFVESLKSSRLQAVTLNPFFPQQKHAVFHSQFINAKELVGFIRQRLAIPVFDVAREKIDDFLLKTDF